MGCRRTMFGTFLFFVTALSGGSSEIVGSTTRYPQSLHPRNSRLLFENTIQGETDDEAVFFALESLHSHLSQRQKDKQTVEELLRDPSPHLQHHRRRLESMMSPTSYERRSLEEEEHKLMSSMGLRNILLQNYDKNSFPFETVWKEQEDAFKLQLLYSDQTGTIPPFARTGVPIQLGLNVHKVFSLDVRRATSDLVVWYRLKWKDPRLAWENLPGFENVGTIFFFIGDGIAGGEASEIWTPDIYLWNQAEPLASTLQDSYAAVSSDGSIFWSRPGRLISTCKYTGFNRFPFDTLSCMYEFGSWSRDVHYIDLIPLGTGFTFGGSETAAASFVEFGLLEDKVKIERVVYGQYDDGWPVLLYTLFFERGSMYYVRSILFLNVVLNLAAFCSFWIQPDVGERTGLAITCVFASVAAELAITHKLPVAQDLSWYRIFAMGSTIFGFAVVFQCAVVTYFYYYTGDDLESNVMKRLRGKKVKKNKYAHNIRNGNAQQKQENKKRKSELSIELSKMISDRGLMTWRVDSSCPLSSNEPSGRDELLDDDRSGRIQRQLSDKSDYEAFNDSMRSIMTTVAMKEFPDEEKRKKIKFPGKEKYRDLIFARAATVVVDGNADMIHKGDESINNVYWKMIAEDIDEFCKFFFPVAYAIFLGIVFHLVGTIEAV